MIKAISLYSGSRKNSFYIRAGETEILIDAGGTESSLRKSLENIGTSLSKISAIFITHTHGDHTGALPVLLKHYKIPVHLPRDAANTFPESKELWSNLFLHGYEDSVKYGGISVSSFITQHDCAASVGYVIEARDGGEYAKIGYATDLGCADINVLSALTGCDACVIEANHDVAMLKNGVYAPELKRRILSHIGHLSNADAASLIKELASHGTRSFLLAHLSAENNTPSLALECVLRALTDYPDAKVVCSCQNAETELEIIKKAVTV